ncbi:two-component system response regulator QseB [Alteromonadaceae bacterium 2753L.S.0a.02]|nr:two-component system response regulator QseB [Alteromonadaceae bacterium 2753L.S.0a.02]
MRVLIVEDDKIIGDGITEALSMNGYVTDWVEDVESASTALKANLYELLILDLGLPDGSGFDILKKLRQNHDDTPVLILTAYDDVSYRVKGLDSGADDYLVKPFKLDELMARLRALRRRANGRSQPMLTAGEITLNPATNKVTLGGKEVNLGPKEFSILHTLMEKKGRVVTKVQLEESLYGWDMEIESNTVEVHIHGLRKKLGRHVIQTLRNVGYRVPADEG